MSNVLLVQNPDGIPVVASELPVSDIDCESNAVPTYVVSSSEEHDFIQQMGIKSSIVRMLCIMDIMINMVNFVYTGLVITFICSILSFYGLIGATNFRPSYLFMYLCYLYFIIMSRLGTFFFMMYLKYNQNVDVNEGVLLIIPVSVVLQTYVVKYVYYFYEDCKKICIQNTQDNFNLMLRRNSQS